MCLFLCGRPLDDGDIRLCGNSNNDVHIVLGKYQPQTYMTYKNHSKGNHMRARGKDIIISNSSLIRM